MKILSPPPSYFHGEDELAVVPMGSQDFVGLHTHTYYELVVIWGGRGIHFTAVEEYEVSAGDVFVLPPGLNHGYRETHGLDLVNLMYLAERLPLPLADLRALPGYHGLFELEPRMREHQALPHCLHLDRRQLASVQTRVGELSQEMAARRPGYRTAAIGLFLGLVRDLSCAYGEASSRTREGVMPIGRLLSHLELHYRDSITLAEMAEMAGMSVSSLHRIFRRVEGVSPVEYLLQLRLRRGAELLRTSDRRVIEVALRVGFSDANYFSRQFRARFGMSPREYRRGGE
ncbi:MAG: helix-turn-helix domain-containing protein [Planctomycetota bacterium]